jgi:MYXO-CTERM domain-containing protein
MSKVQKIVLLATLATVWIGTSPVRAHFILVKPDSWLNEDPSALAGGGPQKGSPCGPGGDDDVTPVPVSMKTVTAHAGDTLDFEMQETIHHPGYFRISLAETDAMHATTTNFPDPPLDDTQMCSFDLNAVPTDPHDNVLADGLFKDTNLLGDNRDLTTSLKLPDDKTCDHCALQIVQVMMDHGGSSCFYYHCVDITILPADGSGNENPDGGTAMGTGGSMSMAGSGGMGSAGTGAGNMSGSGGSMANPMTGSGGMMSTGAMTTGSGGTSSTSGSGGMAATSGTGGATTTGPLMNTPDSSGDKDSGCSIVRARGEAPSAITWIAGALVLGTAGLRTRRRRAHA